MMKKNLICAAVGGFLLTLASCATPKMLTATELNGEWNVVSFKGEAPNAEEPPFIGFEVSENRVYGNAGCNNMFGGLTFNSQKGSIAFGNMASTRRACANDNFEGPFLQSLDQIKSVKSLGKKKIGLCDGDGKLIVTLEKR